MSTIIGKCRFGLFTFDFEKRKVMKTILPILLFTSFLLADTKTVAISYFDNTSGLEVYNPLSKGLADMLITDLSNVKSIQIVEREKLESLLKEIDLGEGKFIDPNTAQKLGKGLGAGYMLTGSYLIMGETMRIDARLVDVGTGEIAMAEEITGKKNTFFTLEKELANKLISTLKISISRTEKIALKRTTTKSFDAMMAYSNGLDMTDTGNLDEAQVYLEKALEYDEEFELAAYKLEEVLSLIQTALEVRKTGLPSELVNLINQLSTYDDKVCDDFAQKYQNMVYGSAEIPDSVGSFSYENNWMSLGFAEKPENYDVVILELGKKYYTIYQLLELLLSKDLKDSRCGSVNPNEAALSYFSMWCITIISYLDNYYYSQNKRIPDMYSQNGKKVIDKWDYKNLLIKYGTQYIQRFPYSDNVTNVAQTIQYCTEIGVQNDTLWAVQKWVNKHGVNYTQQQLMEIDTLDMGLREYEWFNETGTISSRRSLDSIIPQITYLKNLKVLDLSMNDIRTLPDEIKQMKHLDSIDLRNNPYEDIESLKKSLPNTKIHHVDFTEEERMRIWMIKTQFRRN